MRLRDLLFWSLVALPFLPIFGCGHSHTIATTARFAGLTYNRDIWWIKNSDGSLTLCGWDYPNDDKTTKADHFGLFGPETKYFYTRQEAINYMQKNWCKP